MDKARNDLSASVPKFCLALEEHRRTPDGRVRSSQEFLGAFFPHDEKSSTDKVFRHLPNEVRGPIVAAWGVRGIKSALRDNDEKVQSVIHDALVAGDIDHVAFEEALSPETLVRWLPLAELWTFWRAGKLTKQAIQKALTTAFDLSMFDARWFLDTVQGRSGTLKGTDVLADGLNKDDLITWIRRIHESGDGTPKGVVTALGWEKIVAKTTNESLVAVLDAMVIKVGLIVGAPRESSPALESIEEKLDAEKLDALERKSDPQAAPGAEATTATRNAAAPEKMRMEDSGWGTLPPSAPDQSEPVSQSIGSVPMSTEEAINIVLEDELVMTNNDSTMPPEESFASGEPSSRSGESSPKSLKGSPSLVNSDDEATQVKRMHRDPFPPRPGTKR